MITYKEKPDYISWDEIHKVLWNAHKKNRELGMTMKYPSLSGTELEELVGNGKCFVALDGQKVIGTCSYTIVNRDFWFSKNKKTAYYILDGLLPEYQGRGIYHNLLCIRDKFIEKLYFDVIFMDTAEKNKRIQHIFRKKGFKYIGFKTSSTGNFYYTIMAKWPNGCPYSNLYCKIRFLFTKTKVKLIYKPGDKKRFVT